jgi:hypothetical protein
MSREPIDRENAVLDELRKGITNPERVPAYCTATRDFSLDKWDGNMPVQDGMSKVTIKKGTTLKIIRMMRRGGLGITDNLDEAYLVQAVITQLDDRVSDFRWTPEPTNVNPRETLDQQFDAMMHDQEETFL